MIRCSTALYTLCFMYLVVCYDVSHPNLLFKMHLQLAKAANRSNCWVCSKPPPSTSTPAMAAVHAMYDFRVGARKKSATGPLAQRHLSIDFQPAFLEGNVSYALYMDPETCNSLTQPIWVSGQLGRPQICFNISLRQQNNPVGRTSCAEGITIQIDNSNPSRNNLTARHDYLCWGEGCDIQEGGSIPLTIQLLLNSRNRELNDTCVSLTGPYYFLCGQTAYRIVPPNAVGSCSLVRLVPASYIVAGHEDRMVQSRIGKGSRTRRELFAKGDLAWAWFPAWTGWGLELMQRLNNYSTIVDSMFNETVEAVREISQEQRQIKTLLLQEKMALDYLLAAKGGFCEFIGEDCCTWVVDTGDKVQAHLDKVTALQGKARAIASEGWNPFKGLGSFGDLLYSMVNWFREMGVYILMLLLFLVALYVATRLACCIIARTTREDHLTPI